ncbi:MAG: hypothetical protein HKN47_07515 [Pirellulaceae bacterium]|nr:hypothetical protein [Pirellulaceae bacterium]
MIRNAFASIHPSDAGQDQNVVQRLNQRLAAAKQMGFNVRTELLDGQQSTWCVLGVTKVIFLDLSQTAAEQLAQLNEVLADYVNQTSIMSPLNDPERLDRCDSQRAA